MQLNTIKPAKGAKAEPKRVGRGIGSGLGKTCGKGHKGQHARAGGYHKVGFEGGQMPLQRRLPKFGFTSAKAKTWARLRTSELNKLDAKDITVKALQEAGLINKKIKLVKVYLSGKIDKAINVSGIYVTKGARQAIETAGGKVESVNE